MAKRKFDYDGDDFYDEILALAMQGLTDAEIAFSLADKFGTSLDAETFTCMKNGSYIGWNKKNNKEYSTRILKVLTRGRHKITSIVRGAYLKGALGGKKIKSTTVVKRKLRLEGVYTNDEEIQTSESENELPCNMQALATWLYHHDPDWRKIERSQDESATDVPTNIEKGVDIDSWIKKEVGK